MPWKETSTMDQRLQFVVDYLSGNYTKKALCHYYGISRPTGDKWIERFGRDGPEGFREYSRKPHGHPRTTPPEIVERIVETKLMHQSFGPKKVMDRLRAVEPDRRWPADSTAGKILKRRQLVRTRRPRRRVPPDPRTLVHCDAPAQSWSADFKGDVLLANGKRCYPLTLTDNHSRFIPAVPSPQHNHHRCRQALVRVGVSATGLAPDTAYRQRLALCLSGRGGA